MENASKPVENVREVNEFQKFLNDDPVLRQLDELITETNTYIAMAITALAKGEEENPEELAKLIDEARRTVVNCIGMHHDVVMARYAEFVKDESPTSATKNRYW